MNDAFVLGGLGMVGKATMKALDIPFYFDLKDSNIDLEEGAQKLFCFICLPTPTDEKGGQAKALDTIRDYIKQIKGYGGRNIFIIRSTVLPGTCRALAEATGAMVVSNPEFLSESSWEHDCLNPRLKVIGADDVPSRVAVTNLWKSVKAKLDIETDTVTAETIKYAMNSFAVVKVVFANALYDACQLSQADYDTVREVLHQHPWGSKHHLKAVDKGGRGAGGRCLPKDMKAFATWSNSEFLKATERINFDYLVASKKI